MTADREITRGEDVTWSFAWQDSQGAAINLTGRTYASQIRAHPDDSKYWSFTISAPGSSGILTFTMLSAVTLTLPLGRLWWDVRETNGSAKTYPIAERVVVVPGITR